MHRRRFHSHAGAIPLWSLLAASMAIVPSSGPSVLGGEQPDIAIPWSVQADSVLNDRLPPTRLFDGQRDDPASRWASSRAAVSHWVMIELDRPAVLDRTVVHGHDDAQGLALGDAEVQLPDGEHWKTLAAVRDNRQTRIEFSWAAVKTSTIRLAITKPCRSDHTARLFEECITGVTRLEHGQAILHRTPSKFVSFAWGRNRMALAMPRGGNWVVWPHYASYLGLMNGKDPSRRNAELIALQEDISSHEFSICGTLLRCEGQITQDFAFASLEKDVAVYIERLHGKDGVRIVARETGIVGHEYPLESNRRRIVGRFGRRELVGTGNPQSIHELETDWLNLGGQIGHVVRRQADRQNLMRYHDEAEGQGRVPKLQEWFSLIGDADPALTADGDDWACLVTFLNQTSEETARWADRVLFRVDGEVATCRFNDDMVSADFAEMKIHMMETHR